MKLLPLDNDFLARFTLTDEDTDAAPSPAITGLKCRIAATRDGAAINATLDIDMTDTDADGITKGTLQGDELTTHLETSYKGRRVFAILYKAGGDVKAFVELMVVETRAAA